MWNIAGWPSKTVDTSFKESINSFDIILFQETWAMETMLLDRFTTSELQDHVRRKKSDHSLISTNFKPQTPN